MQLIDTHVHINFDVFQSDLEQVRSRWQEVGVVRLVHSCVEPKEFPGHSLALQCLGVSYQSYMLCTSMLYRHYVLASHF